MSRLALKLLAVHGTTLLLEDRRIPMIDVRADWIAIHEPEAGGYYLIDDDGHASFAATLPDDVPAPAPSESAPAIMAHPDDHFHYAWLQTWLELFYAQGESILASHEAIKLELAQIKARS